MKTKQELLSELREAQEAGVLTSDDLMPFISESSKNDSSEAVTHDTASKLSAVDILFYIAGIILFAAILSLIAQTWESGALLHIIVSVGSAAGMWSLAVYLIKSPLTSDLRNGLINSLLLTGSLLSIVGGYILVNEVLGGYDEINFFAAGVMFLILGAIHAGLDHIVQKKLILLMGILLAVASIPAVIFELLQSVEAIFDVWVGTIMLAAALLPLATSTVAKLYPKQESIKNSFDGFASFLILACMYVASFGDYSGLWYILLVGSIIGLFYLSIVAKNKQFLGSGSIFMVLTIITLSFKYFSGLGVTTSLIIAAAGLLGTAAVASNISKKYF